MAMIECVECGNQVSDKAPTCPNCGAPVNEQPPAKKEKEKKSGAGAGCLSIIIIAGVALYFAGEIGGGAGTSSAPAKPKTAQEIRQEKITSQFSAWDGAHIKLERSVEDALKDPDSYEHIETTYQLDGDRMTVMMTFRAKNSFGGYVVQQARGVYDINGNTLEPPTLIE